MKKAILSVVMILIMAPLSYADLFLENAQNAVIAFNSMNKGQGYKFKHKTETSLGNSALMTTTIGTDQLDLGAYVASYATGTDANGSQYFRTFCIEPGVNVAGMIRAKIDYTNDTSTSVNGDSLSIGTAALYAMYVSDTLKGYTGETTQTLSFLEAIRAAMEIAPSKYSSTDYAEYDWSTNVYLTGLLEIKDDINYWKQDYDPGKYYEEVGDYSVFAMHNLNGDALHVQNMLYIVKNDGHTTTTPEPTSVLIVGIGLASILPLIRKRKNTPLEKI